MSKTKGFLKTSKRNTFIKIAALFLGAFFLSTISYGQIVTGKLLLIGNNYATSLEENKIRDLDVFGVHKSNEDLLLTDEVSENLTNSFFEKASSEQFKVLKANDVFSILFMSGLIPVSDKNKKSAPRKKLNEPLMNTAPKKVLKLSPRKRDFKFIPVLVVFTI